MCQTSPRTAARSSEYALAPVSYDEAEPCPLALLTRVSTPQVEFAMVPTVCSEPPRATASVTCTL